MRAIAWSVAALALGAAVSVTVGLAPVTAAAPSAAQPARVHLSAVGDTILGNTPTLPAHPYAWFDAVRRPITRNIDVRFANFEGTFTNETQNKCGASLGTTCFAFRNPPRFAKTFAAVGFTTLNMANNHSKDFGQAGLVDTRHAIRRAGMDRTGLPGDIAYSDANGVRTAVVGFAPYDWTANMLNLRTAARLVHQARQNAPVVVVYMHAGAEGADAQHVTGHEEWFLGEDRGNPERFAHRMVRAGADLVIGSGPHVLRAMQFYRGSLIAYSLGNFASFHNFNTDGVRAKTAILRVTLGGHGGFLGAKLVPVLLGDAGRPSRGGNAIHIVRTLSREDFPVTAARISPAGNIHPPS